MKKDMATYEMDTQGVEPGPTPEQAVRLPTRVHPPQTAVIFSRARRPSLSPSRPRHCPVIARNYENAKRAGYQLCQMPDKELID